jgi:hypothetical protein
LRASQARQSVNNLADQVQQEFEKDYEIETEYHSILDGECPSSTHEPSLTDLAQASGTSKWHTLDKSRCLLILTALWQHDGPDP